MTTTEFRDTGPSPRAAFGTWLGNNKFWLICIAIFLVLSVAAFFATGTGGRDSSRLSITNPAPAGAQAVAEILRDQGVKVNAVDSLAGTAAALRSDGGTTVLFQDPRQLLSSEQVAELADAVAATGGKLVALNPSPLSTPALAEGFASAGTTAPQEAVAAGCSQSSAVAAEKIDGGTPPFGVPVPVEFPLQIFKGAQNCFVPDGSSSGAGFLALNSEGTVAILGNSGILSNQNLADRGNAALALGLLGSTPELLWYTASVADIPPTQLPPSLAEFTPDWLFPLSMWLLFTALIGMLWKGRRPGPLVVEPLPVIVKSSETLTGRARLYQDAGAAGTAGRELQLAALTRLAQKLRLGHAADPNAVVHSVAAVTGGNADDLAALLLGEPPRNDKDLWTMAVALAALEEEVTRR